LGYILLEPWIAKRPVSEPSVLPEAPIEGPLSIPAYQTILVPLDHSELDRPALRHAAALARQYGSKLLILHVEEGVTSQIYGPDARTAEELEGSRYLNRILERMAENGVEAEAVVAYSGRPRKEIIRVARERSPDLIVMGAHGHKGLKDIIFGSTINAVRHNVRAPVLAIQRDPE